jgi:hypothetical protein
MLILRENSMNDSGPNVHEIRASRGADTEDSGAALKSKVEDAGRV